ncbi:hypothetical protein PFLmoz3_05211 [Pseudomonas fluorescens]|uniref:Uncharacterized protein n=1 Tax=Pseudomonas fluorescens TaxID=294 RepID=A0A109LCJ6_PSEFL|nr:hypothetical protein PFLmoz3_05211 [Pseudomonas fluorescens]
MEIQVVVEGDRIEDRVDIPTLEQRWQRRGETQALAGARQVQGLHTETVTSDEQTLGITLPDGESEHAVELGQQRFAPGVITLEQHFGVATGIEGVTQGFQLLAQLREIIDSAIERQGQPQMGVDHRLGRAVRQVHDLQAAVAQGNRPLGMKAPGVGASGGEVVRDAFYGCQVGRLMIKA